MTDLMSNHLPLRPSTRRHGRARDNRRVLARSSLLAESGKPRDADFRACRASAHQVPKTSTVVTLGASPFGEDGETIVQRDRLLAGDVPREVGGCRRRTSIQNISMLACDRDDGWRLTLAGEPQAR